MSRRGAWALSLLGLAIALAGLVAYGDQPIADLFYAGDGPWAGFFSYVTMLGSSVVYLVPLGLAAVILLVAARQAPGRIRAARLRLAASLMFVFAAIALSGLTVDLIKVLVGRARPYLWRDGGIYQFAPPGWSSLYQSFPSGHSSTVVAAALATGLLVPAWRWPLLGFAGLLALTRLAVGAHYPSDLLAGAAVAVVVTLALRRWCAARGWLFRRLADGRYCRRGQRSAAPR
jgi:membrane-associated phospholipid phosphatase